MSEDRLTVGEYLRGGETNRPQELVYGVVREPASPGYGHQVIVGRLFTRLDRHVRRLGLGRVVLSPIDVILDARNALVVQPDLAFVSKARLEICRKQIWGPPDLTIEVLSNARRRHDRVIKAGWYHQYGVREYWIVDPAARSIELIDLRGKEQLSLTFEEERLVRSAVLPRLRLRASHAFED